MVGVSYHELQATSNGGQPRGSRHSAAERKQFLVVCVVGFGLLSNAFLNAGLFESVRPKENVIFPGGEFVYKLAKNKDYASTGGFWRQIANDLRSDEADSSTDEMSSDNDLYSVYVDNLSSGYGRFFTGVLTRNKPGLKKRLLNMNMKSANQTADNSSNFQRLPYEVGTLPKTQAISATFPFTDGFVSALLHNYKVFPSLERYAKEKYPNGKLVIITTCNRKVKICTHYVPVKEGEEFLMGHPRTEDWVQEDIVDLSLNPEKIVKSLKKLAGLKNKDEL
jgi:hypothetical protein